MGNKMLELIKKIKLYTEAGIILEHMELFDELLNHGDLHRQPLNREEYSEIKGWERWGSMQEQNYMDYVLWVKGQNDANSN